MRQAGGGLGLGVDQERGEVGRRHFDIADDEFGHEHGAVDDDHLGAVGQVDDKVATNRVNVAELNAGGKRDDTVGARHDALRIGLDDKRCGCLGDPLRRGHVSVPTRHACRGELLPKMRMNRMSLRAAQRSIFVSHDQPFCRHGPWTGSSVTRGMPSVS